MGLQSFLDDLGYSTGFDSSTGDDMILRSEFDDTLDRFRSRFDSEFGRLARFNTVIVGKLLAQTITVQLQVGGPQVIIDGANANIVVRDTSDVLRVKIGNLGADYGIEIYNSAGTLMWSPTSGAQTAGIADDAVSTIKIVNNAITETKIGTDAVTTPKIAANAVTANEIAANTITANEIAANAITTSELAADSVTADKIVANTITASEIAANTITAGEIAPGAVTSSELASASVIAGKIATNAIIADDGVIGTAAIKTAQIADAQITSAKIVSLVADKIAAGSLTVAVELTTGKLRTASAGARLELDSDGVSVFNSSGNEKAEIDIDGLALYVDASEANVDGAKWWRRGLGDSFPFGQVQGSRATSPESIRMQRLDTSTGTGKAGALTMFGSSAGSGEDTRATGLWRFTGEGLSIDNAFLVVDASIASGGTDTVSVVYGDAFPASTPDVPRVVGGYNGQNSAGQFWRTANNARTGVDILMTNENRDSTGDLTGVRGQQVAGIPIIT